MTAPSEIVNYKLKALKSGFIPVQWVMVHFDGNETELSYWMYREKKWNHRQDMHGEKLTVLDVASMVRSKEQVIIIGNGVYPWLCAQGLYEQFTRGDVWMPTGNGDSNKGNLRGQLCCNDPTIIDLVVGGKKIQCLDLENWGISESRNIDETVRNVHDIVAMITRCNLGSFRPTAAGQGACRYRTHDMGNHLIFAHQMPNIRQLEREAFYGGRAEACVLGKIGYKVFDYDYRSLHPTIGLTEKFPCQLVDFADGRFAHRISKHSNKGNHIIAKCIVKTDRPCYPLRHNFSIKGKDWRTIYPIGTFKTVLCWPEFSYALKNGHVLSVEYWAAYKADSIFRESSEWYLAEKQNLKDSDLSHLADTFKLIQNCLYGGIGKRGRRWMDTTCWHDAIWGMWWGRHPQVGNVVQYRAIYGQHQYLDAGLEPETSCPAISATMFSYSRMALLQAIDAAGKGNVLYYDTDGLMVTEKGAEGLARLGDSLAVKWESDDVDIRGIKYYRHDNTWIHAGIPAWAIRHLDGSAEYERHEPFNYGLWHGTPFAAKYLVAKNNPYPQYKHGHHRTDNRIDPFRMDVIDEVNRIVRR